MHRLRPHVPWVLLLPLVGCHGPGTGAGAPAARRPNLIVFLTDDHASHAVSAYGSRINHTPNLDRLAIEGLRFSNAFVENSLCAPSRATLLTGKFSHAHGVVDNRRRLADSERIFPELLAEAGYQTALVGKWHLKAEPRGFEHWEILNGQGTYYNPRLLGRTGQRVQVGYTTDVITDLALEWLEKERDGERPFLLMVQHKAPHRRWFPGPGQHDLFAGEHVPEPTTLFDDHAGRAQGAFTQEMSIASDLDEEDLKLRLPPGLTESQRRAWNVAYDKKNEGFVFQAPTGDELVRWKYQRYIKDYLRCVAAVDDGVGRILDWLDEHDLARDTAVVYTSDQGFFLGDHGWFDKRWMYEESLRTPLLVRWPAAIEAGSVDEHLVQNIDLAPTLLELAGAPVPADVQGRSLVPLLLGRPPRDWRRSIYYRYYEAEGPHAVPAHVGVRTERHKLILFPTLDQWELYDLEQDPEELHNRYGAPELSSVQGELHAELERLREEVGDPAG